MDSERINDLLSRYWNCETSLEEEQELRAYFSGGEIPESLKDAAPLFKYFEEQKGKSLSDVTFENQVLKSIDTPKKGKTVTLLYNTMRIAAGVAVLVAAVWFIRSEVHEEPEQALVVDTYDDPKLAFEETKKALMMISKSFGRAEEETKKINLLNEAQQEVKKKKVDS